MRRGEINLQEKNKEEHKGYDYYILTILYYLIIAIIIVIIDFYINTILELMCIAFNGDKLYIELKIVSKIYLMLPWVNCK